MEQGRLFRLAHEAINVSAWWEPGYGWRLRVVARRGDQSWAEADTGDYECLSTEELVDCLDAHLRATLGL